MPWEWITKGMLLGLSIAAPVGPISVLCIRKTMARGFQAGLFSGLGAATADAVYGILAGFSLTALTAALMDYKILLQVLGGLFICGFGIQSLFQLPAKEAPQSPPSPPPAGTLGSYAITFLLTLSNPMTIMFFLGVFSASGILVSHTLTNMLSLVAGVFLGSALWWVFLAGAAALLRNHLLGGRMRLSIFNKVSGGIMCAFGVVTLVKSAAWFI
ncbi:LysE family translocator [Paenibacillus piscarius]|uniref:LysE family translocator n=1 Tax=Paenibacillus piscarius TaxID=1089681 RepID=UPI001EE8F713|nr:LysE family transporter [Paenibacillus piscarius]